MCTTMMGNGKAINRRDPVRIDILGAREQTLLFTDGSG